MGKGDAQSSARVVAGIQLLDAQEEYLIKTGYSECTRETMRNYISVVMRYFQNAGITKLEELNSSHVSAYLLTLRGHAKSTVRCELSRLRKFLSYLYLLGYTSENLAPHVPEYRLGQAQSIIKIWESEEINAVLETVNRASPKGKRDYAFITIAAELGVRSKDICNLKLSDIDWELCSISFVQSKTGKPNTLPLSEKVGSAIIDYLHIRPQTKCEYLFVSLNPPYGKMKSIHSAFHRYVARSGVKVPIHAHHGLLRQNCYLPMCLQISFFHFLAIRTENLWDITSVWILKTCVNAPCRLRMVISYEQNLRVQKRTGKSNKCFYCRKAGLRM